MNNQKWFILVPLICLNLHSCQGWEINSSFPIGLMDVKMKHLKKLREGPFNIVHNYDFEEKFDSVKIYQYLEESLNSGLKTLLGLERDAVKSMDSAAIRKCVRAFKDHPALGAWYLSDEPDLRGISPDKCRYICNLIRELDPNHPIIFTIALADSYQAYINIADVMFIDPYPIPLYPPNIVGERVTLIKKYGPDTKIGVIIQAFDLAQLNPNLKFSRAPTLEELSYMAYSAIINGVSATFFFSYHQMSEEFFHTVCYPVAKELSYFSRIFLLPQTYDFFVDTKISPIEYRTVVSEDTYFLLVANPTSDSAKIVVKPSFDVEYRDWKVETLFLPKKVADLKDFQNYLPPFGVQIYRIYNTQIDE